MAQVDQYSDDGQDIKKTVNGVTRYLERDDQDGQYYWVKASGKRESLNLGTRLSARTGGSSGKGVTDLMTMYMWLRKQKAQKELAATPSIDVDNMDNNEWDAYSNAFSAEFNPSSFATSKALNTCVHTTTFLGDDKYDETKSKKNTFVWKGDVKVQEDDGVFEPCQNVMFFGVVEDTKDLFKYTAMPGDVNALGRDICNALYTATKSIFGVSKSGNYNAINAVLSKPQYRPSRSVSLIVLQKVQDGGKSKMNVYKFVKGMVQIGIKPRFFLVPKSATLSDSTELTSDYYTMPDDIGDFNSQLHVVCGNALFMGSTSEGFLDWLFSNNYNKLTSKTLSPGNCKTLAEDLAQKNPGKTVTVMYAVIDEEGVDSATTVFETPPGPPPGPIPDANIFAPEPPIDDGNEPTSVSLSESDKKKIEEIDAKLANFEKIRDENNERIEKIDIQINKKWQEQTSIGNSNNPRWQQLDEERFKLIEEKRIIHDEITKQQVDEYLALKKLKESILNGTASAPAPAPNQATPEQSPEQSDDGIDLNDLMNQAGDKEGKLL
jgi:hypothetical protein